MPCPACNTVTRAEARFCPRCGLWLRPECPRCGSDLTPLAIYCDRCGTQVSGLPAAGPLPAAAARLVASSQPAASAQPDVRPAVTERGSATAPAVMAAGIPRELEAKLEAARASGQMVGERRIVTMLFCDVKGSTEAAERLDPEEWTEIMNGAFERMIKPVYTYEGTLARLMGDALLAFFGAPIAHEDDPQRAVQAALDIQRDMAPYREAVRARWDVEVNVRVGINTGLVVVGAVGSDLRVEYTALGDAINLAARMEQTAVPGTVQIAHDTYRHVRALFEIEPLGGIEVKGKSEPVQAYRVLGRKAAAGRVRGIEGLHAPMVGREAELQGLRAVLDDVQQGVGRIVCVLGEAGLGKSRLAAEARQTLGQPNTVPVEWHETGSLSYESSQPYGLFHRLMRRVLGLEANTPAARVREQLATAAAALPAERQASAQAAFEALFGLEQGPDQAGLAGADFQRELYEALGAWWLARWEQQPAVLVFDDMHWSDAASVALLRRLLPLTERIPLVVICLLRTERQSPAWQIKTTADDEFHHRYTEVLLRPLTSAQSSELIDHLLAQPELPDPLRASMLEKTGGNPFFIEEVVRTLIDSGVVVPQDQPHNGSTRRTWRAASPGAEVVIPDNLQALMAARLDRLDDSTRGTLQLASVIGRHFYYRVLAQLAAGEPGSLTELDRHLGALVRAEMIQEAARVPEVEYRFRNPLMQEAAYHTILLKRRREFHLRVGEAMETLFAGQAAELAPRLAYHFDEAGDAARALKYLMLAGDRAARLYANQEAVKHYERALALATAAGADTSTSDLVHLFTAQGRVLELDAQPETALALYQRMEALAQARGDQRLELAALMAQGTIYGTANRQFDAERALAVTARAETLACELDDGAAQAKILWNMMNVHRFTERGEAARAAGEKSLDLARALGLREQMAYTLNDLFYVYQADSRMEEARAANLEARALWRELGNRAMLADNLSSSVVFDVITGDLETAQANAAEALAISRAIGNIWGIGFSQMGVAIAYWMQAEFDRALEALGITITYGERSGFVIGPLWARAQMATVYGRLGHPQRALELIAETRARTPKMSATMPAIGVLFGHLLLAYLAAGALDEAEQLLARVPELRLGPGLAHELVDWGRALFLVARRRYREAEAHARATLERMQAAHMLLLMAELRLCVGQAYRGQGRTAEARAALLQARAEAGAGQLRWTGWQIEAELAGLAEAEGSAREAAEARARARALLEYIAAHVSDEALRAGLLAREDVRAVMEA